MSAPTCPECGEGPKHCDDCEIARSLRREAFIKQVSAQQKSDALHRYAKKLGAACTWQPGEDGARTYCVDANGEGFDVASEDEALKLLQDIDKAGGAYDTSRVDFHRLRATVESMMADVEELKTSREILLGAAGDEQGSIEAIERILAMLAKDKGDTLLRADVEELKVRQRSKRENVKDPLVDRDRDGWVFEAMGGRLDVFRESDGLRFEMRGCEHDRCVSALDRAELSELGGVIRRWLA